MVGDEASSIIPHRNGAIAQYVLEIPSDDNARGVVLQFPVSFATGGADA